MSLLKRPRGISIIEENGGEETSISAETSSSETEGDALEKCGKCEALGKSKVGATCSEDGIVKFVKIIDVEQDH